MTYRRSDAIAKREQERVAARRKAASRRSKLFSLNSGLQRSQTPTTQRKQRYVDRVAYLANKHEREDRARKDQEADDFLFWAVMIGGAVVLLCLILAFIYIHPPGM